ncbi:hypothetical protein ABPG75_012480 [Micractinium tetrahymenae]
MDILFLRPPQATASPPSASNEAGGDGAALQELQDSLRALRRALHAVLLASRSASTEARQWLLNSIAALELTDAATKRSRFDQFLPGGAACRCKEHEPLVLGLLQLAAEAAPREVGALVAEDGSLLRHFFKSDPKRVPLWFGHFSMEGMRRFKLGAAALAQYAMEHRAEMWGLLAWQGRHPQAPVAVAQRTHYFCELDVPRTVRHLIKDCPDFWSSPELRRSVEQNAAQLLALDPAFWNKELLRWLQDDRSDRGQRLTALLRRCLATGSWRHHCQRLLHLLPKLDLLPFAEDLLGSCRFPGGSGGAGSSSTSADMDAAQAKPGRGAAAEAAEGAPAQPGAWLVFRGVRWQSLEQLVFAAALGCCLPLLLRLLREDEQAEERAEVQQAVQRLLPLQASPAAQAAALAAHWRLREQLRQRHAAAGGGGDAAAAAAAAVELCELLLLQLFAAAFLVDQLCRSGRPEDADQLQRLLAAGGFPCQLAAEPGAGSSRKRKERRHREGKKERRKVKQRRKSKRRRRSRGGSDSDSGSSDNDSEDECRRHRSEAEDGWLGFGGQLVAQAESAAAAQPLWRVGSAGEGTGTGGPAVSSLELLDAVVDATASAHADWVFG